MSPNLQTDRMIIARQLLEKSTLTFPTVYKHRILEMTAQQRLRLIERMEKGLY